MSSSGHPAESELARHWRGVCREATSDAAMRDLQAAVVAQLPEEFRSAATGTAAAASSSEASPTANLPIAAFMRALAGTAFARQFFRQRIREVRTRFYLAAPDCEADALAADAIVQATDVAGVSTLPADLCNEYAHVDCSSLALLASCHEKLGELATARLLFAAAAASSPANPTRTHSTLGASCSSNPAQYRIEVERLTRQLRMDARRKAWPVDSMHAASSASASVAADASCASAVPAFSLSSLPPSLPVERIHHSSLSYADFVERFVQRRMPVVIEGLAHIMFRDPAPTATTSGEKTATTSATTVDMEKPPTSSAHLWNFHSLAPALAHLQAVPLKYSHRHSQSWARLEERGTKSMTEIIEEMVAQREREIEQANSASSAHVTTTPPPPAPPSYYVHDYSLVQSAPSLLHASFTVPLYFSGDLLQTLAARSMFRDSWPSLFLGARGSRSDLHVDAWGTHFWMAVLGDVQARRENEGRGEGKEQSSSCDNSHSSGSTHDDNGPRKRWLLYHPDEVALLYPRYSSFQSVEPLFDAEPYQAMQQQAQTAAAAASSPEEAASILDAAEVRARHQHVRFPLFLRARPLEALLWPGDVLFVPAGSPHHVDNLRTCAAISANCVLEDNLTRCAQECALAALAHSAGGNSSGTAGSTGVAHVAAQMAQMDKFRRAAAARRDAQCAAMHRASHGTTSLAHSTSQPQHMPFSVFKMTAPDLRGAISQSRTRSTEDEPTAKRHKPALPVSACSPQAAVRAGSVSSKKVNLKSFF